MNEFKPDWDAMAVMVEEMQRMAQHIEKLEAAVKEEREACARVCEEMQRNGAWITKEEAAAAIRARGEEVLNSAGFYRREWAGLTAAERMELWWGTDMDGMPEHAYGKKVEALLKEKNT